MWAVDIEVENRGKKIVKVRAVHSDDISGVEDFTHVGVGIIQTPAQRTGMMDAIQAAYLLFLSDEELNLTFLAGLEDTAENALNVWEATL